MVRTWGAVREAPHPAALRLTCPAGAPGSPSAQTPLASGTLSNWRAQGSLRRTNAERVGSFSNAAGGWQPPAAQPGAARPGEATGRPGPGPAPRPGGQGLCCPRAPPDSLCRASPDPGRPRLPQGGLLTGRGAVACFLQADAAHRPRWADSARGALHKCLPLAVRDPRGALSKLGSPDVHLLKLGSGGHRHRQARENSPEERSCPRPLAVSWLECKPRTPGPRAGRSLVWGVVRDGQCAQPCPGLAPAQAASRGGRDPCGPHPPGHWGDARAPWHGYGTW